MSEITTTINNAIICGKGWEEIYIPIIKLIFEHDNNCTNVSEKIGIEKITCRSGMLDIVVGNEQAVNHQLKIEIQKAKHKSLSVCEYCGTKDNVGYSLSQPLKTCCKKCYKEYINNPQTYTKWLPQYKK